MRDHIDVFIMRLYMCYNYNNNNLFAILQPWRFYCQTFNEYKHVMTIEHTRPKYIYRLARYPVFFDRQQIKCSKISFPSAMIKNNKT